MKKKLTSIGFLCTLLFSAQDNRSLMMRLEKEKNENLNRYQIYRSLHTIKEDKSAFLVGFSPSGNPLFLEPEDRIQIKNSNADFLQNGTITGLNGSFNGENINVTIFDGGRVFAEHTLFNNIANRITNKEDASLDYSAHSTAVAGFVGAKPESFMVNTSMVHFQGIASNSKMDSYTFTTTTLPGASGTSSVFQKILTSLPKLSNHSYGTNNGWNFRTVNGANAWVWYGRFVSPNTFQDLQGSYYTSDKNYDEIVYNNPNVIIVKSAGNYFNNGPTGSTLPYYYYLNNTLTPFAATDTLPPNNCVSGYDCINNGSLAKNIIVVAATNKITSNSERYTNVNDVVRSGYSSAGPRDDGGIKPDIATVGTGVSSASTAENTTGSNIYTINGSGTSYAAPVVTGVLALWTQIHKQLFNNTEMNAHSAKTLLVHSASEAGANPGPDAYFGWGFLNAKKGAELLVGKSNNTVIFENEIKTSGIKNTKTVKASGTEPLKVTLSWIDPEYEWGANTYENLTDNRASRLINDLDLRIIDTTDNTITYPWRLDAENPGLDASKGDNTVDNVEQVVIENPVAGRTYRIEITNKGTLIDNASTPMPAPQNYSIMVTGHNEVVLGNQENSLKNSLIVVPTVTKDFVQIQNGVKKGSYQLFDTTGKLLQNEALRSSNTQLDLSNYPTGVYIIKVTIDKETLTYKVIRE